MAETTQYWTKETDAAIVRYNQSEDVNERNQIFNESIRHPLEKLVENIFNTFKFEYVETDVESVQKETLGHLVSSFHYYDISKGKGFSYFSRTAKNYLMALNIVNYKKFNTHVPIVAEDRTDSDDNYATELVDEHLSTSIVNPRYNF